MSVVSVTSASQILESFGVKYHNEKGHFQTFQHMVLACIHYREGTQSSCGGPLTWKAQIHDVGHQVNFDRNLASSCFVVHYNSFISMN